MRHFCRCSLHPVLTLLAVGLVGSVVGLGLHVWMEPWTSAVAVAVGSVTGLLVSHALGESVMWGFALGGVIALFALGIRGLASVLSTTMRGSSIASAHWFER